MLPIVGALISGGLSLIGNALEVKGKEWIKDKTGVELDIGATKVSPEEMSKLRQAEMIHEEELLKIKQDDNRIQVELEKAYLADVQSARGMQIEALKQDDLFSKRFLYYFSIAWSAFAMVYILVMTLAPIPVDNQRFADTILGFLLATIVATMFNFIYGSSRSSQQKDNTVSQAIAKIGESR